MKASLDQGNITQQIHLPLKRRKKHRFGKCNKISRQQTDQWRKDLEGDSPDNEFSSQGMVKVSETEHIWRRRRSGSPRGRRWIKMDHQFIALVTFLLCLVLGVVSAADSMWDRCDPCSCKWIRGKKAAECMDKNLATIPRNLSSDLQVIDLSDNMIPELRKNEFTDANLQNLHMLFMRRCTLQSVHRDSMTGLNILIELDMSDNNLRELPVGFFASLQRLRSLVLNGNQIEVIEDRLFQNMQHLHKIDLKGNNIHSIGLTAFVNLPVLGVIALDSNNLSILRKGSFDKLDRLKSLSIGMNPWNCTCDLEEFKQFVVNHNLHMQTTCETPLALKGRSWVDLTENFACRPRVLRIRPSSRFRSVAENETLECEIYASPRPEIFWLFNKKPLNSYESRYKVRAIESYSKNGADVFITRLTVVQVRPQDKGTYTCVAANAGGKDEGHIYLERSHAGLFPGASDGDGGRTIFGNIYVLIALIILVILALFALVVALLVCCRRGSICGPFLGEKKYKGDKGTASERVLMEAKGPQDSMVEGGSVILELQKSLLTEVNPVEKPPRRTEVDANGTYHEVLDDKNELKKMPLDETAFGNYARPPGHIQTHSHSFV